MLTSRLLSVPYGVQSFTYVGNTNVDAATASLPAGTSTGDLAIFIDTALNNSNPYPTAVNPSGWTTILSVQGPVRSRAITSYRVIQAGDTSVSGMTGTSRSRKMLMVFRPDVPISTVSFGSVRTLADTTGSGTTTLTIASAPKPMIALASYYTNGSTSGSVSLSISSTSVAGGSIAQGSRYRFVNIGDTISDATATFAASGVENIYQSFYVSVT